MSIALTEVEEADVLPLRGSLADFIAPRHRHGRFQVLEGQWTRASDWHPGVIAKAGGTLPDWWSDDPVINCNPLFLYRVPSAYYMPSFGVVISSDGMGFGASLDQARYLTPDLTLLPGVTRQGDVAYLSTPETIATLDRALVTMPWGAIHNYGHFVLDCLSGLAAAFEIADLRPYSPVFPQLKEWQNRHVEILGVQNSIQLDNDIYFVDDLIFCSSMASFLQHPNVNYRLLRERQLANIRDSPGVSDKVYVARPKDLKRDFVSDHDLRLALEQVGFATIYPDQHSVDAQIAAFHGAELIVGCAGAAFANVLYCKPDTKVVEIIPMRMVEHKRVGGIWVYNICALIGCLWRPYFCAACWSQPTGQAALQDRPELDFSFELDVDDFMTYLRQLTE